MKRTRLKFDDFSGSLKKESIGATVLSKKELDRTVDAFIDSFLDRIRPMSSDEAEKFLNDFESKKSIDPDNEYITKELVRRAREELKRSSSAGKSDEEKPIEIVDDSDSDRPKTWDDLLEDVFTWYQIDTEAFIPVDVKTGRKFRGLGYILSFKGNYGKYMGTSYQTMVYKVWDPRNKYLSEFNTDMVNLLEIRSDTESIEHYKTKWNMKPEIGEDKVFQDFKEYFTSLVNRAKGRCGSDYRYMKNYLSACTRFDYGNRVRAGLPEELTDQIIEFVKSGAI